MSMKPPPSVPGLTEPVEGLSPAVANMSAEMRRENPQGYALSDAPYTVVSALPAAWRALYGAGDRRGPRPYSGGTAAALGRVAGG